VRTDLSVERQDHPDLGNGKAENQEGLDVEPVRRNSVILLTDHGSDLLDQ
jgi:hypothetical protein